MRFDLAFQPCDDIFGRDGRDRCAERRGERKRGGDAALRLLVEGPASGRFDMHRGPRRIEPVGEPFRRADKRVGAGLFADRDQDALAGGIGADDAAGIEIVQHLAIDAERGAAQRHFTQGGEVRFRKEMAERPARLLRYIDLAVLEPVDQFVGRQVDKLDLRRLEHAVGHRFAHPNAREAGDDVVQALDMLDIQRGVDVDPGAEQFLDILPTLRVPAALDIGVGIFVDERERGRAAQHGIEVHLAKPVTAILDLASRHDFHAFEQRLGLGAAVRFDDGDDDILALALERAPFGQHCVGLADAGRGTEEYLELTPLLALRLAQERLGRRAFFWRRRRHVLRLRQPPQCGQAATRNLYGNFMRFAGIPRETLRRRGVAAPTSDGLLSGVPFAGEYPCPIYCGLALWRCSSRQRSATRAFAMESEP